MHNFDFYAVSLSYTSLKKVVKLISLLLNFDIMMFIRDSYDNKETFYLKCNAANSDIQILSVQTV